MTKYSITNNTTMNIKKSVITTDIVVPIEVMQTITSREDMRSGEKITEVSYDYCDSKIKNVVMRLCGERVDDIKRTDEEMWGEGSV